MRPASAGGGPEPRGIPGASAALSVPLGVPRVRGQGSRAPLGHGAEVGEGGARAHFCHCGRWRPGQASSEPLTQPGGSPSVTQREGSCPSKLGGCGNTCGQARTEGEPQGENFQTPGLAAFPFQAFPRPMRLKEFTGANLETVSLQQDLAFAWVKREAGKLFQGRIDLQIELEIFLPKPAAVVVIGWT